MREERHGGVESYYPKNLWTTNKGRYINASYEGDVVVRVFKRENKTFKDNKLEKVQGQNKTGLKFEQCRRRQQ